jgi:hypothetical protein
MKKYILILFLTIVSFQSKAQLVFDPGIFAQNLIEQALDITVLEGEVTDIFNTLSELGDIYNQGKDWYDSLKEVKQTIDGAGKIYETVRNINDIQTTIRDNLSRIRRDPNFTPDEIQKIATGYDKIIGEGISIIEDLLLGAQASDLSLTDNERIDIIDDVYNRVRDYKALVIYYTKKNISVSFIRAKKRNNQDRIQQLYGR